MDVHLNTGNIGSSKQDSLKVCAVSGLYCNSVDIINSGYCGLDVCPKNSVVDTAMYFDQTLFDTGQYGAVIQGEGETSHVHFNNCWSATNKVTGLYVAQKSGKVQDISWLGGTITNNANYGVYLAGNVNTIISNAGINNNCVSSNNTYDQVYVTTGSSGFQLIGNDIQSYSGANKSRSAVFVESGNSNHYMITQNRLSGGILDKGLGKDKIVNNNLIG